MLPDQDHIPENRPTAEHMAEMDDIIYRMSHDMIASIRALKDLPDWIAEDLEECGIDLAQSQRTMVDLIQSHARRLDAMVSGLLTYSRIGRLQEIKEIETRTTLRNSLKSLSLLYPDISLTSRLAKAKVFMGETDLERLINILVTNAVEHHPTPVPKISVLSFASQEFWELHVTDDGIGIPAHLRDTVFKPMFKLMSRDENEGGGMGLAIARKIVARYNGSISVSDAPGTGSGTVFMVRVPLG
jgi:signal transduction histidine kinase